jgi:hypothetical protein
MLCPHCKNIFRTLGHPAHVAILRACYRGFVDYDDRNITGNEIIKYLELKGYIVSTETGEYQIAYKASNYFFNEPFFCWCHKHVESNEE